ncbi:MAG: F0F1 ATP synthase subunit A [Phycisphaerales bacterium]
MTESLVLTLAGGDPLHHNYDYPLISLPSGYALLTNHILLMLVVTVFMLLAMPAVARRISTGRTGTSHDYVTKGVFAHLIEIICVFFRDQVAKPVLGSNTDKFMPFIWTTFFFILFNNLLGLVPLLDTTALVLDPVFNSAHEVAEPVDDPALTGGYADPLAYEPEDDEHGIEAAPGVEGHEDDEHLAAAKDAYGDEAAHGDDSYGAGAHDEHHVSKLGPFILFQDLTKAYPASHFHGVGGTATGNIAVTFALALIAIIVVIGAGIRALGLGGFLHHLTLDAPVLLWPLTVALEIIGLMAKPFALMVRLFANMTAGHVMLSALLGFAAMAWNGLAVVWLPESETWTTSFGGAIAAILIAIGSILFATAVGLLELLVAFIQAYIFTFLTTMFISMFQHHGHEHHDKHTHDDAEMGVTPSQSFTTAPAH